MIIDKDMPIEVVRKNIFKTIGEAPHWDAQTQSLCFVDIFGKSVFRWNSITNEEQKIVIDDTVGFVIPWHRGGVIVGCGKRFVHLDWNSGKVTVITEVDQGVDTQINDGKCDARGRIWAGTFGKCKDLALVPKEQGSLFCLDLDGSVKKHVDKVTISNGIAWSADNSIMYYIDSVPGIIYSFEYYIDSGTINNRKTVMAFEIGPFGTPFPDGMTIDTDGMLWVACFFGGTVVRINPNTGKQIRTITMPAQRITSCCFGGKSFDELFVTCCSDEKEEENFPLTGSLFKVTGLGVKGHPANVYKGRITFESGDHRSDQSVELMATW